MGTPSAWLLDVALTTTPLLAAGLFAAWAVGNAGTGVALLRATLAGTALLLVAAAVPGRHAVRVADAVTAAETPPSRPTAANPSAISPDTAVADASRSRPFPPPSASVRARPSTGTPPVTAPPPESSHPHLNPAASLAAVWLLGCGVMLVRLAVGAVRARRLVNAGGMPPAWLSREWDDVTGGASVPLRVTHDHPQALLVGAWRPTVLLPVRLASPDRVAAPGGDADERAAALRHEWAHVVHGDPRWRAAARVLGVPLWWHPLFHVLTHRLRAEGELLADAAAARTLAPDRYAAALLAWARHGTGRPVPGAVTAFGGGDLTRRVEALLSSRGHRPVSRVRRIGLTAAVLSAAGLLAPFTASGGGVPPGEVERTRGGESESDAGPISQPLTHSPSPRPTADAPRTPDAVVPVPRWGWWEEAADVRRDPFTLAGTIYGMDRRPLAGATVDVRRRPLFYGELWEEADPAWQFPLTRLTTDAAGQFAVTLERPVPLQITAVADGRLLDWVRVEDPTSEPLALRAASDTAAVRGRLVLPDGTPAVGVPVRITRLVATGDLDPADEHAVFLAGHNSGRGFLSLGDDDALLLARTDGDGRFEFRGLPVGHVVQLRAGGGDTIPPTTLFASAGDPGPRDLNRYFRDPPSRSPFTATVPRGAAVTLRVVDEAGAPAPGVRVIRDRGDRFTDHTSAIRGRLGETRVTGPDGTVTFAGLPAGAFLAWFDPPVKLMLVGTQFGLDLADGGGTSRTVTLEPGVPVFGRVVDAVSGAPVPGAELVPPIVRRTWVNSPPVVPAVSDAEGRFRLVAPFGVFGVTLAWPVNGYAWDWEGPTPSVPLPDDGGDPVTFPLEPVGFVRVTVLGPDGRPAADVAVRTGSIPGAHGFHAGKTGRTGPDGTVRLTLNPGSDTDVLDGVPVTAVTPDRSLAATRSFTPGSGAGTAGVRTITLTLAPSADVRGRVTDPAGKPIADIGLRALESNGEDGFVPTGPFARTDVDGRYRLDGVIPGLPGVLDVFAERHNSSPEQWEAGKFEAGPGETVERNLTLEPLPPPAAPPADADDRSVPAGPSDGGG